MATDDFTPDLSKLEQDYQILTELHRSRDSRTYLARHLELNRDVTITVVRRDSSGGGGATGAQSLSRFAGDVERLKTVRHPNVIPVIEGRWLADGCFAVVRARVRGSTLDQLVSAVGPVPLPRAVNALQQVQSALDWARTNAIANRAVDPDTMVFQQGSGRVLLSLEPSRAATALDNCEDVRVIGRLSWEMLAGQPYDPASPRSLAELRPELSPQIVAGTEALLRCAPGNSIDVPAYIAMLGGSPPATAPVTVAAPAAITALPLVVRPEPVGSAADAVVVRKQGWGFGARFALGVAVLATIAIVAFVLLHRDSQPVISRTAASGQTQTGGEEAGDVAAAPPDTAVVPSPSPGQYTPPAASTNPSTTPYPAVTTNPTTSAPAPSTTDPATMPNQVPATGAPPVSNIVPPTTRRHEPMVTTPPLTMPASPASVTAPSDSTRAARTDSGATMADGDVCASPTESDQHKCLMDAINRNDVPLNAVYQQLNAALRRQANVSADDPAPATVEQLHAAEREWMDARDQACHGAGSGPLYASARAQCFANQSAKRTRELQQMLDAIPEI